MSQSFTKGFENKLRRLIGELVILVQLSRKPEGIHPYELSKNIENIAFPQRKKQITRFSELHVFINDIIELFDDFDAESPSFQEEKEKLLKKAKQFPLFCANRNFNIDLLFNSSDLNNSNINLQFLKRVNRGIEMSLSFQKGMFSLWEDVTRVYPVLRDLQSLGAVEIKKQIIKSGRTRKIYILTPSGRIYGQFLVSIVLEVSSFVIPFCRDFIDDDNKKGSNTSDFPLRKQGQFPRNIFQGLFANAEIDRLNIKDLLKSNELFIPMMGRPTGFDEPLINFVIASEPILLDHVINQANSDDERKIITSILRLKIQELQESLNSTLKKLDDIELESND